MLPYKKILLPLAFDADSDRSLVAKAKLLEKRADSPLYLLHVIEPVSSYGVAYGISGGVDVESIILEEAQRNMKETATLLNVPTENQIVTVGSPKWVIIDHAEKLGIDLILMGSHGRHGIQLLLGSTANAVLHGAKCDVLAVRLTA